MLKRTETYEEKIARRLIKKQHIIRVAAGKEKADMVLKNATYLNVFSNDFCFFKTSQSAFVTTHFDIKTT